MRLLTVLMAALMTAGLALIAPAAQAAPAQISFANGVMLFLSGNGATGHSSAFVPAPARNQFVSTDNRDRRFGFRNDDARSLRLINVRAPLTIKVSDNDGDCYDNVVRDANPRATIFIRASGTYTIGSFEGSSNQGPLVPLPQFGGGIFYSQAVVVSRTGRGQLDGKISCISSVGTDRGNPDGI